MPNNKLDIAKTVKKVTESYYGEYGKKGEISTDHIMVYLLDRLKRGTDRLNLLTFLLIILTLVLAVLTGILVRQVAIQP